MIFWNKAKDGFRKIKGAEWALLLVVLGLAGSFLISPGSALFANNSTEEPLSLSDPLEARIAQALSCLEGAGKVEVIIHYERAVNASASWLESSSSGEGEPVSAIVLAEGADIIKVRLELSRAIETLLRLDSENVEIFKMGNGEKEE